MNKKTVCLSSNEKWPILNILNEVCNGINIVNFRTAIGDNEEVVIDLMDKISQEDENDSSNFEFSVHEIDIIRNSFVEVSRQIEDWEFQTRIGITREDALQIGKKIWS